MPRVATLMVLTPVHVRLVLISLEMEKNVVRLYIHLFQKTLSKRTTNGSCRTEIARPKGTVVSMWTNHMTQHRRSALYGSGIMEAYFLLIFNTHISFQSCNRRSTIDARRSPQQHFFLKKIETICIVQIK